MSGRHILLVLVAVVATACVSIFAVNAPPPAGVTLRNFQRLHSDMTWEQIEGILGKANDRIERSRVSHCSWTSNEGDVLIGFYGGVPEVGVFYPRDKGMIVLQLGPSPFHIRLLRSIGFAW